MNIKDIKDPKFLKTMNNKELKVLASDIRSFLIENISKTGGHLASNLGVVELSLGLHYTFNSPEDAILFDVSHQAYTHKILTGRAPLFDKLRQKGGLSGYAKYLESSHDKWESGHAGTSIAAMVGYLCSNQLKNKNNYVISVVGDASISNGTNMEALNFLGQQKHQNGIIIINDNHMSISKSVGAISKLLIKLRGSNFSYKLKNKLIELLPFSLWRFFRAIKKTIKTIFRSKNIFEDLGYYFVGPIDGNNIGVVLKALKLSQKIKSNVVVHMITQKGKGYEFAEIDEEGTYHGVGAFDKDKGLASHQDENKVSWSEGIAGIIDYLALEENIFVVIPAMMIGSKFTRFQQKYPNRIIDVGIAEEHAAVMSAALALNDVNVFLPIYSTFSQRAYDQILNDIARPNLKVVIGIDRAGFVGEDGSTHQGLYDVSMFLSMPNVIVTMPKDLNEALGLLKYAYSQNSPFVIRYPRGYTEKLITKDDKAIKPSWEIISEKEKGYIIIYGPILNDLIEITNEENLSFSVVNARYIRPLDEALLKDILATDKPIFVYEHAHGSGSLYHLILEFMATHNYNNKITGLNAYNKVIEHGSVCDNVKDAGLDKENIIKVLKTL